MYSAHPRPLPVLRDSFSETPHGERLSLGRDGHLQRGGALRDHCAHLSSHQLSTRRHFCFCFSGYTAVQRSLHGADLWSKGG